MFAQPTAATDDELFRSFFQRLRLPITGNVVEAVRIAAGLTNGEMDAVMSSAGGADGELNPNLAQPEHPTVAQQRKILEIYLDRLKIDLGPARFQHLREYVRKTESR